MTILRALVTLLTLSLATPALAQGTQLAFGPLAQDTSAPIEIEADELAISQADGSATFTGNVVISQGAMRLAAPLVTVVYDEDTSEIAALLASGGVTLVSGTEAAESDTAEYFVLTGTIVMSGNVLLSQGRSSLASQTMTVDLAQGTAVLSGRVRTILQLQDN